MPALLSTTFAVVLFTAFIYVIGNALYRLALPIELIANGHSASIIGYLLGGLSAGGVIGGTVGRRLVENVGHIRVYCASVAVSIATIVSLQFSSNLIYWALLIFLGGIFNTILYVALESWINSQANNENRGSRLGIYLIVYYISLMIGQYAVNIGEYIESSLLLVPVIFVSLSIVPIAMLKSNPPEHSDSKSLGFLEMVKRTPVGSCGEFCSGLIHGPLLLMIPVLASAIGLNTYETTLLAVAASIGAITFQYPIGKISDRIDRRKALLILVSVALLLLIGFLFIENVNALFVLMFLTSGFLSCMHPTSTALVFERIPKDLAVGASGKLLVLYGLGITIGQVLTGVMIEYLRLFGFVLYTYVCGIFLIMVIVYYIKRIPPMIADADASYSASQVPPPYLMADASRVIKKT